MPPDRDRDIDRELRDLGPRVEYPPVPDLTRSVRSRLDAEAGGSGPPARSRPQLWWIAAAALVLLVALPAFATILNTVGNSLSGGANGGGVAGGGAESGGRAADRGPSAVNESRSSSSQGAQAGAASPEVTSVISDDAATISPDQEGGSATDSAVGVTSGESLGLGERITLREAHARSEAPILRSRSSKLGTPDEVYDRVGAPGFTLLYRAGPGLPDLEVPGVGDTGIGLLLTETPGDIGKAYLASGTVRGAGLKNVGVDGGQGYWIPPRVDRLTVARSLGPSAGVLLWERDGQALRLEADLPKKEAVRIAESVS